jgi:putative transposase
MSRPLRIEFPGAIYHVTSRGDRREPIYQDDVHHKLNSSSSARSFNEKAKQTNDAT